MSKMSKFLELSLKRQNIKELMEDENKTEEYIRKRSVEEDEPFELPKVVYHTKVEIKEMFGFKVVTFNENTTSDYIILYLHGGAYINEIDVIQTGFCDRLAKKTNSTVFVPIYPLTPNHTYKETYTFVEKLYDSLLTTNKHITIMGDSAGGGLSAAFCEYLAEKELLQPEHLILISPWVDVSMSGDYDDYIELDPMLGVDGLRELGIIWADDLDTKNYKVSPLYGDVEKLPKTSIFLGTHEIFYPDVVNFYNKLKDDGVDVELIIGDEMPHVYPIYPLIPESKEALNRIVEIILN